MGAPKRKPTELSIKSKKAAVREKALDQTLALFTGGGKTKQVHLSDIASELVRAFKGPRGLALRVYMQYLKAGDGSHTRTKILDMVMKMVISDTTHNSAGGNEIDDMDELEIKTELEETLSSGVTQDAGDLHDPEDIAAFEDQARVHELQDPEVLELEAEIERMEMAGPEAETPADIISRLVRGQAEDE